MYGVGRWCLGRPWKLGSGPVTVRLEQACTPPLELRLGQMCVCQELALLVSIIVRTAALRLSLRLTSCSQSLDESGELVAAAVVVVDAAS